jgi:succinate dehydrogenase hydrophobic anchor subunit
MPGSSSVRGQSYKDLVASILALIIALLVLAFVGKFLWNASVAELFTCARPVTSAWQIIALLLLVSLFR